MINTHFQRSPPDLPFFGRLNIAEHPTGGIQPAPYFRYLTFCYALTSPLFYFHFIQQSGPLMV